MRIALAQINTTVGDFSGNVEKIRATAREAKADLVVFPELSICGYMPRDLLREDSFRDACDRALRELASDQSLPPVVVGCPLREEGLLNAAVLICQGGMRIVAKRRLPNYDVFDERRYFRHGAPSEPIPVAGRRVGFTVCEDLWTEGGEGPFADLAQGGAEVIVNLSASPFHRGKSAQRREVLAGHARRQAVPAALCNLVGANDQLIFDGNSCAVDAQGKLCANAAVFREDLVVTDFTGTAEAPEEDLAEAIVLGIADYFRKTGFTDAIVGMSGGVDSSLVAALAVRALGREHVVGVGMPGPYSADYSLEDARAVSGRLGTEFLTIPIREPYELLRKTLARAWGDRPFDETEENLQARLRGTLLMSLANKRGALVLVPSNKSELAMGYCTLYGDSVGALAPISDLYKTEVYAMARREEFDLPRRVLERPPSAELAPDQTDQDSLPPYEVLDPILRLHLEERRRPAEIVAAGFDRDTVNRVVRTVAQMEFKRQQCSPVLKVTPKAFGLGRRFPIAERFRGGVS
ncbi:MAG: NAD+ synthase [Planctomycetota bacterium]|jgi:NAD+ synthetase